MKVGFVAGSLGQGGAERQLFHILSALRQNGALPCVYSFDQNGFWERRIRDLDVPITWIGRVRSKGGRLLCLLNELRRDPPMVLQSQHFYTNGYVAAAAAFFGLSSIGALRSNGNREVLDCGRAGGWLNLRAPRLMAANSQAAIRYAASKGVSSTRLFLLLNVVDTGQFSPKVCHGRSVVRLISVGRLIGLKRFDRFVSLVARLRQDLGPVVRATLVGAGPLCGALRAQAEGLGLPASALDLPGSISEVAPVYQEADIFVLTSECEGTPNALLEAMASGLPVVASKVGDVPELVRQGSEGFLVEPDDDESLCTAVKRLIREPQLRFEMGQNARAHVEAHHSLMQLPIVLERLYSAALGSHAEQSVG